MFLGEYTHSIDDKGRLTIPAKFRGDLAAGLVLTRGFDQNLMIYPLTGWQTLAERIQEKPVADKLMREFRRRVFSGATDLSPDRQGRIIVPPFLREFAGIDGEAVVVGMFDYLELWSVERWEAQRTSIEDGSDDMRWQDLGI
ncbi:MAG: division/cell wall cluster transcriptional repressor MraZ [Anaerolineae bacterium]|nr:division/cell wall cluster transcriptional repressor MraZ [Anaerolineae bacterium]MCO5188430.1 division/cell wall cluster transcriptional repressor MraZ [Anaerolineae bacterium]MCO5192935.1 division/cell wall cluster transcriptional repressor MraZ [Anaerolineae bacterium]MCO5198459.1 division/cell wall cluster transcriptional repressor MraZ [Anaerolineae bacterium]MCO5205911.1 division/cell wall cluster transcriptional repressor MraZ [Anaerolineae bacterium]